jgi:hypothetical protein
MSNKFKTSEFIPIEWAEDGTSPPAVSGLLATGDAKIRHREFDDAADNDVIIPWNVPMDIQANRGIKFQVVGVVTNATGPIAEDINFDLRGYCVCDNEPIDGVPGSRVASSKTAWTAIENDLFITTLSQNVTVTDLKAGGIAFLNLRRLVGAASEYGQVVGVTGIKIQYIVHLG